MFAGLQLIVKELGTVITDPATGQELTVTDTEMVRKGNAIYMTQKTYDLIKINVDFPKAP